MQRVLHKPYTERDVADVELYVRDAVHGLGDVVGDEQDQARGARHRRRPQNRTGPAARGRLRQTLSGRLPEALAAYRVTSQRDLLRAPSRAA